MLQLQIDIGNHLTSAVPVDAIVHPETKVETTITAKTKEDARVKAVGEKK